MKAEKFGDKIIITDAMVIKHPSNPNEHMALVGSVSYSIVAVGDEQVCKQQLDDKALLILDIPTAKRLANQILNDIGRG